MQNQKKIIIHSLTKTIYLLASFPCTNTSFCRRTGMQNSLFYPQCLHLWWISKQKRKTSAC